MENKNQGTVVAYPAGDGGPSSGQPFDPQALALMPEPAAAVSSDTPTVAVTVSPRTVALWAKRGGVALGALMLVIGFSWVIVGPSRNSAKLAIVNPANNFDPTTIPLEELGLAAEISEAETVAINGTLDLSGSLIIGPSLQPATPKAGQIYYDQNTNKLAYYNGSQYISLDQQGSVVQSVGGASGQLGVGTGLAVVGNQLLNAGVVSVGGQSGSITLGNGLVMGGNILQNNGILSISPGSSSISVVNDGNGNVTLDLVGGGTGTVTSGGGTNGTVALFTGSQNIENSIVTQSGGAITVGGNLAVTGALSLGTALTVANGGTGATSLTANGVIVGHGTSALTSVTAAGTGLCLMSTVGAPAFSACPGGGGGTVTSLNGLTGALTVANSVGVGSTITLDNATTAGTKGIATFNSTNFSDNGSGTINTIQNINSGATPTFAGVNTNSITPSAALTVGVSAQTALLQGSTTTITSSGVGNDIVLNSADTIELQDNTNVTGNLAASGDLSVDGGDINSSGALNITPTGTLTAGSTGQTLTLQGNASTSLRATNGGNTTIVGFTSPTANTTLNFPAVTAGTYTVCISNGNCAGAGVTLQAAYDNSSTPEIVLDATRGALTIRDTLLGLGGNLLEVQNNGGGTTYLAVTASGIAVTGTATVSGNINSSSGALQTGGTTRIDASGNATNIGSLTLSGAISGGTSFTGSGNVNSTGGAIQTASTTRIDNSGNLTNIGSLTASGNGTLQGGSLTLGTTSQAGSLVLHDGNGQTITVSAADVAGNRALTIPAAAGGDTFCLQTLANCAGSGGGVTTAGGTPGTLPVFTAAQVLGDSLVSQSGGTVAVGGNLNLTSSGVLQTGGTTRLDNSGNLSNIASLALTGAISGATTITASGNINTTAGALQTNSTTRVDNSGNLTNIGNLTATGAITINSTGGGNDIILNSADTIELQDNTNVTGNLDVSGTLAVGTADAFQVAANGNLTTAGNATLQGGSVTIGTTSQLGSLIFHDGNGQTVTISVADVAGNRALTVPAAAGADTFCLLTLANCVGTGGGITGSGTTDRLAKFTGAGSIGNSTISDNGTNVTTTADLIIQGGDVTVGVANTQTGTINFADSGSAFLGSLVQGALGANQTYTLPDSSGEFCLTSGNCLGGGAGGANTALSNLSSVAINTTLLPGSAGAINLGSTAKPFGDIFLAGTSGTPGTNNFKITGASTGGLRTITLPDTSGTACLDTSSGCIQNQNAGDQAANFQISGTGRAATFNATTGVNTGAGAGTQRIDASGNLVNIGTLSASGTIATTTLGTANTATYVCRNSSNQLATCSTTGAGVAFVQGGNTLGATATFGTNDGNQLDIRTNGSTRVTVGSSGGVTLASGNNLDIAANTLQGTTAVIDFNNFDVSSAGVVTLAGGQTRDITTAAATTATALLVQPGTSSGASSNGAALTLRGGDGSGTTSVTGGTLTLQGGSATGASGTRIGGNVVIDAGTGSSSANNGTVGIGTTNASAVSISRSGIITTVNGGLRVVSSSALDELEVGDDIFNLNDSNARINVASSTNNAIIRVGQSTIDYGYLSWVNGSPSYLTVTNSPGGRLVLQETGGPVAIGANFAPAAGVLLAISGGNLASVSQSIFVTSSQGSAYTDIDSDASDTSSVFRVTRDNNAATLFNLDQNALATFNGSAILQGGSLTLGTASSVAGSLLMYDANGQKATITLADIAADRALSIPAATGSDTFCLLTLANCTGGSLTGSGTSGKIAKFTGTTALGDSIITESGGTLTIQGGASGALTVRSNINGGNLVVDVQRNNSTSVIRLTDDGELALGSGSSNLPGIFDIADANNHFGIIKTATNISGTQNYTLPASSGTFCLDSNNCSALMTLQAAYNNSPSPATTPEVKLTASSSRNSIDIQDADSTIGTSENFLSLRASNGSGLGNVVVGFGINGNLFMQPSTDSAGINLVDINTSGGNNLFTINSSTQRVGINLGSTNDPGYALEVGGTTASSTSVLTPLLDTAGAVDLNLGTTNATAINLNENTVIASGKSLSLAGGNSNITANNAATGTTGTTEATPRTNVTTVTLIAAGSFANNDVIFINNSGQDYFTRIVSGGGTTSLTVSPMVSYDASAAVTKYTVQNIGATTTDYTTLSNRFFQGYFLGGVVTGAGSTTLSDGRLNSTGRLNLNATDYMFRASSDSSTAFQVQNAAGSITALTVDTTSGTTVSIGGTLAVTNGLSITGGGLAVTGGIDADGGLLQGTGGMIVSGNVSLASVGSSTAASTVHIADTSNATGAQAVTIGSAAANSSNITIIQGGSNTTQAIQLLPNTAGGVMIGSGTGTGTITLGQSTDSNTINIGNATTATAKTQAVNIATNATGTGKAVVIIGNTNDSSSLSLQAGTGNLTLQTNSASASIIAKSGTNGATAFQVQDSASAGLLTVDTTARSGSGGNLVKIGNSTGTDTAVTILQLDGTSADPTTNLAALNGGLFYNNSTHKVSLIENGAVKIICNTTDLGCGTGTVTLQSAYGNSSDPEITLGTASTAGVSIRDNATPISGNLFEVQNNARTTTYLSTNSTGVGVGIATATRRLHVSTATSSINALPVLIDQTSTGDSGLEVKNTSKSWYLGADTSNSSAFSINSSTSATTSGGSLVTDTGTTADGGSGNSTMTAVVATNGSSIVNVTSLSANIDSVAAAPNNRASMALYTNLTGPDRPGTLIAFSQDVTLTASSTATFPISAQLAASQKFWIVYNSNGPTSGDNSIKGTSSGSGGLNCFQARSFDATPHWPTSFGTCTADTTFTSGYTVNYNTSGTTDNFNASLFSMSDTGQATFRNYTDSSTAFRVQNTGGISLLTVDTSDGNSGGTLTFRTTGMSNNALQVQDYSGNSVLSVSTAMGTNFGAAATTGAFISRNSYFGLEYNKFLASNNDTAAGTTTNTSNRRGDMSELATSTTTVGTTTGCTYSSNSNALGGTERIAAASGAGTSDACSELLSTATNGTIQKNWAASNLPLMIMKVKPSAAPTGNSNTRMFFGLTSNSTASLSVPTDGIFFTNCTATTPTCTSAKWIGMVVSGGTASTVTCNAAALDNSGNINTSQFNYLRIEVRSSTDVHFFVDTDVSASGIIETECGTGVTTNIPSAALGLYLTSAVAATGLTLNSDVDYVRIWQDDAALPAADPSDIQGVNSSNESDDVLQGSGAYDATVNGAISEYYPAEDPTQFQLGDVVAIDEAGGAKVRKTKNTYDNNVLGVIAASSKLIVGQPGDKTVIVATNGRAPIKVSTENGAIQPGDLLTASNQPGVAMRATANGAIIGQALDAYTDEGVGTVLVRLNVSGQHPIMGEGELQAGSFDQLTIGKLNITGDLTVTGDARLQADLYVQGNLFIAGHLIVSADTGGTVTIVSGQTSAAVAFAKPYETIPVVTASPSDFTPMKVSSKTKHGFMLLIPQPLDHDLQIDWTAIESKSAPPQ